MKFRSYLLSSTNVAALAAALRHAPTAGLFGPSEGELKVVSPFHAPIVAPGRP